MAAKDSAAAGALLPLHEWGGPVCGQISADPSGGAVDLCGARKPRGHREHVPDAVWWHGTCRSL